MQLQPVLDSAELPDNAPETQISFFPQTEKAWEAMYADCAKAEKSIEFEQYILGKDPVGDRFLKLFAEKARAGVRVRLILDCIGSRAQIGSPYIRDIRSHGGDVYFFNPINWANAFSPTQWFPRNHTKTLLIDSKIAFIGSACIAAYMADWRDTQARVTGGLAREIEQDFAHRRGHLMGGKGPQRMPKSRRNKNYSPTREFSYLVSRPRLRVNPIYSNLLAEIGKAASSVRIASPYFLPPRRLRTALKKAAARGVKVEIMVGEKTDVHFADLVSRTFFKRLIESGIAISLYRKSVLHTKYSIVDGRWATIGSTNMDYLSLWHNREANIIIRNPDAIRELDGHFDADLKDCIMADVDYVRRLPLTQRIAGRLGRLIKKFL